MVAAVGFRELKRLTGSAEREVHFFANRFLRTYGFSLWGIFGDVSPSSLLNLGVLLLLRTHSDRLTISPLSA